MTKITRPSVLQVKVIFSAEKIAGSLIGRLFSFHCVTLKSHGLNLRRIRRTGDLTPVFFVVVESNKSCPIVPIFRYFSVWSYMDCFTAYATFP